MNMITVIVRDSTGLPLRKVTCQPSDLAYQAGPGETVAIAKAKDLEEHTAQVAAVQSSAKQYAGTSPDPMAVLVEALKAKGLELTPDDLAAARVTLDTKPAS